MNNQQLWDAIFAYNRQAKQNRENSASLEKIRAMTKNLSQIPDIQDLLAFLGKLRTLLGERGN